MSTKKRKWSGPDPGQSKKQKRNGKVWVPRTRDELKVVDQGVGTIDVSTTGVFTLLNGTAPGTDFNQRTGRKITCKSVYIRGRVNTEASTSIGTTSVSSQQARCIVFIDHQPNAAAPAVTDLLVSASPSSQLNLNNRDRFRIVRDETYVFDPYVKIDTATQAVFGATNQVKDVSIYAKLGVNTVYNAGTAGTVADITSDAVYMFWIGSRATGVDSDANAVVSARLRFIDP